ncbi:MAG: chromosome partitioning protein ParB, partial [Elusimicrobiota bacterium]|nr:chromosome partitioning protein ParB [Elusimicrobiota bacterium]
ISSGKLSSAHGRSLAGLSDEKQIKALVQKILNQNLSVRELEKNIGAAKQKSPNKNKKKLEIELEDFNVKLQQKLGTKTCIKGSS